MPAVFSLITLISDWWFLAFVAAILAVGWLYFLDAVDRPHDRRRIACWLRQPRGRLTYSGTVTALLADVNRRLPPSPIACSSRGHLSRHSRHQLVHPQGQADAIAQMCARRVRHLPKRWSARLPMQAGGARNVGRFRPTRLHMLRRHAIWLAKRTTLTHAPNPVGPTYMNRVRRRDTKKWSRERQAPPRTVGLRRFRPHREPTSAWPSWHYSPRPGGPPMIRADKPRLDLDRSFGPTHLRPRA
jgi:hypothetical protein